MTPRFVLTFLLMSAAVPGWAQMLGSSLISTSAAGVVSAGSVYATSISATSYYGAIPSGLIAAFASTTCPSGWSEYTAARGRFLRGIDNGAGNDPDGTRSPGATQADMVGPHTHPFSYYGSAWQVAAAGSAIWAGSSVYTAVQGTTTSNGTSETRPKNVAVLFCQKN